MWARTCHCINTTPSLHESLVRAWILSALYWLSRHHIHLNTCETMYAQSVHYIPPPPSSPGLVVPTNKG